MELAELAAAGDLLERWPSLPVLQRRRLLASVIDGVVVTRLTEGGVGARRRLSSALRFAGMETPAPEPSGRSVVVERAALREELGVPPLESVVVWDQVVELWEDEHADGQRVRLAAEAAVGSVERVSFDRAEDVGAGFLKGLGDGDACRSWAVGDVGGVTIATIRGFADGASS